MNPYYFTEVDFTNATNVNVEQLQKLITDSTIAPAVINTSLESVSDGIFIITIFFTSALSEAEETTLHDIVDAYTYNSYADVVAVLKDIKSPGINGGTFTSGSWNTRELNTLIGNVGFVALNNNQFTLDPGTYSISVNSPACDVDNHQIRLKNMTLNTIIEYGTSEFATKGIVSNSTLHIMINIPTSYTYEVQHICFTTAANIGLGKATGFAVSEIYTTAIIQKFS